MRYYDTSLLRLVLNPLQKGCVALVYGPADDAGNVVRMEGFDRFFDFFEKVFSGFEQNPYFQAVFHFALPPVIRPVRRHDIRAGDETVFDEVLADFLRFLKVGEC